MKRNILAVIAAMIGVVLVLAGFYFAFFAVAAHIPPGRELGMAGAALGLFSGTLCVIIAFVAYRWAQQSKDK